MDTPIPQTHHTVAFVLAHWPQAAPVFLRRRTNCVGCAFARFCSLEEVAAAYLLDDEALVDELRQAVHDSSLLEIRRDFDENNG
jgi:hybrid cluster-associated redox disulfide protein